MPHYSELNDIVQNIIGERFLRNQNLCKLLYRYPEHEDLPVIDGEQINVSTDSKFDPIETPFIEDTSILNMEYIFPMPKSPNTETKKICFITVVLSGGYDVEVNDGFRRVNVLIDIVCHLDCWNIKGGYRPYKIMHEIDKMLNNQQTDLPIINKPYLRGFQPRDYSHLFYGFQLLYELSINSNVLCDPEPLNLNLSPENLSIPIPESPIFKDTVKRIGIPKNLGLK